MRNVLNSPASLALATMLAAPIIVGCGETKPYDLVPVSGVVTFDGKPAAGASLVFQPIGGSNKNPGPGSNALCDDQGRFEMETVKREAGAVVGTHRVKLYSAKKDDYDPELFPARYNISSELTFDVPADGTTTADFALTSK